MSAAAPVPITVGKVLRRVPRFRVAVPIDVTVLRSGIPDCVPGRSLNMGEHGLAAILAGEVRQGDSVGVEFRLPDVAIPLSTKAVVRHHAHLECGLEFVGLSAEQEAMLRYWSRRIAETMPPIPDAPPVVTEPETFAQEELAETKPPRNWGRVLWPVLAGFVLIGALGWWNWYHAWAELEARLPGSSQQIAQNALPKVPGTEMERLLTHRVDPIYPESAREAKTQGVVVLNAVVGSDGTVKTVQPVSGPAVLTPAALEAVRWWRFEPYRVKGKPVEVETTVAIEFQP